MEQPSITVDSASPAADRYDLRHGFRVGFLQLLLPAQTRSELLRCEHFCTIPETPDWFVGFINHRGETVPVYDIAASMGLEATETKRSWLLLLDEQPATAALLLADMPQGITNPRLLSDTEQQPGPDLLKGVCSGQYQFGNGVWFEFDYRAYFSAQKQRFSS